MSERFTIARVTELPELGEALEASRREGYGFVERAIADFDAGTNRFDRDGEAFFVARDGGGRVLGICGLNIDPYANEPSVGRVRHLYVRGDARRRGIARSLVEAVIAAARGYFSDLHLRTDSPAAAAFYKSLGFVETVDIPSATHRAGKNILQSLAHRCQAPPSGQYGGRE